MTSTAFCPINRLAEYAAERPHRVGVAPLLRRAHRLQPEPDTEQAAPQILEWCREDGVDAVLLAAL